MKRFLLGLAVGLLISGEMAFAAWTISGRNSEGAHEIEQTGLPATSVETGITATPSGTLANSYQLTAGVSQITTVATIGDSVRLQSTSNLFSPSNLDASLNIVVVNDATKTMSIFPYATTDVIVSNGTALGAGAPLNVPVQKTANCYSISPISSGAGRWYCQVT